MRRLVTFDTLLSAWLLLALAPGAAIAFPAPTTPTFATAWGGSGNALTKFSFPIGVLCSDAPRASCAIAMLGFPPEILCVAMVPRDGVEPPTP